jgi:hypothetical protein
MSVPAPVAPNHARRRRPWIKLAGHAIDRLDERCAGVTLREMRAEILEALDEGRVACRKPRVLHRKGRRPRGGEPAIRFCWTPTLERVYVLRRAVKGGERGFVVLTVLTPWARPTHNDQEVDCSGYIAA